MFIVRAVVGLVNGYSRGQRPCGGDDDQLSRVGGRVAAQVGGIHDTWTLVSHLRPTNMMRTWRILQ